MSYEHNSSLLSLDGHIELNKYRYLYLSLSLVLYIVIVCCNSVVIWIICVTRSLHVPMYIFIAALLVNALFGSTVFYPKLPVDLLSDKQVISYPSCVLQAFFIYTYGGSEFSLLTVMAYDRYVSICRPLQYSSIIKISSVKMILLLAWLMPACGTAITFVLTTRLTLCKFSLNRIYCDDYSIASASCGDKTASFMFGFFLLTSGMLTPFIFIIVSYIRIIQICMKSSKDFKTTAFQTCLPHLCIFTNFSINAFFEIIQLRLDSQVPHEVRILQSIEFVVLPPLFNPIIYALKLKEISKRVKKLWN